MSVTYKGQDGSMCVKCFTCTRAETYVWVKNKETKVLSIKVADRFVLHSLIDNNIYVILNMLVIHSWHM